MALKPLINGMSQSSANGGTVLRPLVGGLALVPSGFRLVPKILIAGMSQSPTAADSAPTNISLPVVSPVNVSVGMVVSCTTGNWTDSPTGYTYQWLGDGLPLGGATASSYTAQVGDIGTVLSCEVTASNSFGSSAPATSNSTNAVTAQSTYLRPGGVDTYFRPGGVFIFLRP